MQQRACAARRSTKVLPLSANMQALECSRMSDWQTEKAERNKRSLARLSKSLPEIFPPAALTRALGRPFVPPTPRLAIDSYWRAHPLRADRLARALAARTGAPNGWNWRLGDLFDHFVGASQCSGGQICTAPCHTLRRRNRFNLRSFACRI